jgi:hypothetical protein
LKPEDYNLPYCKNNMSTQTDDFKERIKYLESKLDLLSKGATFVDDSIVADHGPSFPWLYYDPKFKLFANQNSVGSFYKINSINLVSVDTDKLEKLIFNLESSFRGIRSNLVMQFIQLNISDMDRFVSGWEEDIDVLRQQADQIEDDYLYHGVSVAIDQLKNFKLRVLGSKKDAPIITEHFLSIYFIYPRTFSPKNLEFAFESFFGEKATRKVFSGSKGGPSVRQIYEQFISERDDFLSDLGRVFEIGAGENVISELGEADLIRFLRPLLGYQNLNNAIIRGEKEAIANQVIHPQLKYSKAGFRFPAKADEAMYDTVTNERTATYNLELYPKKINFGAFASLNELKENFILTTTLYPDEELKNERDKIVGFNFSFSQFGSKLGKDKYHKEEVIYDRKIRNEAQKPYAATTSISFWGNEVKLKELDVNIRHIFDSVNLSAPYFQDNSLGYQSHISCLPFGSSPYENKKIGMRIKAISESCGSLLPIFGNFPFFLNQQSSYRGSYYQTTEGNPKFLNPEAFQSPAAHTLILGDTGSGKSVFMNYELRNMIVAGGSAFVVDPGSSMKSTIELYGGKFYVISHDSPLNINIFRGDLFPIENGVKQQYKFNFLVGYLVLMVYGSEITPDMEKEVTFAKAIFGEALKAAYQEVNDSGKTVGFTVEDGEIETGKQLKHVTLGLVRDKIKSEIKPDMAGDLRTLIIPYCQGGQYGEHTDKDYPAMENITVMGIDTRQIEKLDKKLTTLILYIFSSHAESVFQKQKEAGKEVLNAFVIDEAHRYLVGSALTDIIKQMALEARKFKVRLIIASQYISHFTGCECGLEALSASYYMILLMQDSSINKFYEEGVHELSKIQKSTFNRIKSLKRGKRDPAPFYLYSKVKSEERGFFIYYATKRDLVTFSSDAKEHSLRIKYLNEVKAEGLEGVKALNEAINRAAKVI